MFSDNETSRDLLGFEDQVEDLCAIALDPLLLPVTIGVLGDWGSGKSSLLKMAGNQLEDSGAIVVTFSPWRIESYDDAKVALLDAVISEVAKRVEDGAEGSVKTTALAQINRLRKRVKWFRAAGLAAKHLVTMSAPSLDDLDGLLRDDAPTDSVATTEAIARDFHCEFGEVVSTLDATVIVLVDDLDRCLPEQVLDVLQAIRLFLSVPGTAFVLATDERVVRDAVRIRYPQASAASETDLPQEYLEKIVQVPLRVPAMGAAEVESYMNLLIAERHFDADNLKSLHDKAVEIRASGLVPVAMNLGIARDCLGNIASEAEGDFELVARTARLLAIGLKGNPRQVKRFLNGLDLRRRAVRRRGLSDVIDDTILAKLAVLEYAQLQRFRTLHEWQSEAEGRPSQLSLAERLVVKEESADEVDQSGALLDPVVREWAEHPWTRSWLSMEPSLVGVDLRPYFLLARDVLHGSAKQARQLAPALQALLDRLASAQVGQRDAAVTVAEKLNQQDLNAVVLAGVERMPHESSPTDLGLALVSLCGKHSSLAPVVFKALGSLPYKSVGQGVPMQVVNRVGKIVPTEVLSLLGVWERQSSESRLSRAASQARKLLAGKA